MLIEHAPRKVSGVQSLMYVGDDVPAAPSTGSLVLALIALGGTLWFLRKLRAKKSK